MCPYSKGGVKHQRKQKDFLLFSSFYVGAMIVCFLGGTFFKNDEDDGGVKNI